jgi:hypothetical protein
MKKIFAVIAIWMLAAGAFSGGSAAGLFADDRFVITVDGAVDA